MNNEEVRCTSCNRLLAKIIDGRIEIKNGDRNVRIHGMGVVMIDCDRCDQTVDVPMKVPFSYSGVSGPEREKV